MAPVVLAVAPAVAPVSSPVASGSIGCRLWLQWLSLQSPVVSVDRLWLQYLSFVAPVSVAVHGGSSIICGLVLLELQYLSFMTPVRLIGRWLQFSVSVDRL